MLKKVWPPCRIEKDVFVLFFFGGFTEWVAAVAVVVEVDSGEVDDNIIELVGGESVERV